MGTWVKSLWNITVVYDVGVKVTDNFVASVLSLQFHIGFRLQTQSSVQYGDLLYPQSHFASSLLRF